MGRVTFPIRFNERDFEVDATIVKAFKTHKLAGVHAIYETDERLSMAQVEDLIEEIGEEQVIESALDFGAISELNADDAESVDTEAILEEMNIE